MIKGVNKKVIEINHPDSVYFERAVLYLRPDVAEVSLQEAQAESAHYFQQHPRRRLGRLRGLGIFLLGALSYAGIRMLAMWLMNVLQ